MFVFLDNLVFLKNMNEVKEILNDVYSKANVKTKAKMNNRLFLEPTTSTHEKKIANRDYYVVNSKKIKSKKKEKVICPSCLKEINRGNEAKHMKTEECRRVGFIVSDNIRLREEINKLKKNHIDGTFL